MLRNFEAMPDHVTLYNFEAMPYHVTLDSHLDVDLLASGYFLANAVPDSTSEPDAQPFYENSGYRVVNVVLSSAG